MLFWKRVQTFLRVLYIAAKDKLGFWVPERDYAVNKDKTLMQCALVVADPSDQWHYDKDKAEKITEVVRSKFFGGNPYFEDLCEGEHGQFTLTEVREHLICNNIQVDERTPFLLLLDDVGNEHLFNLWNSPEEQFLKWTSNRRLSQLC